MFPNVLKTSFLAGCVLIAGGGPLPAMATTETPEPKVIAVVNGQGIPSAVFQRALQQQIAMGQPDSPELRARLRENLIAQELLYQEAVRRKLDQNPAFRVALESAKKEALSSVILEMVKVPPVADAEVRAAYDESLRERNPEDVRLRAIVIDDEDKARQLRSSLARGGVFETLAAEHSRLPSARNGGDLGWMNLRVEGSQRRGPLPSAVTAEVRKLSKGGFTRPVADRQGRWWIVKVDDVRTAETVSFEQAAPPIRRALEAAARQSAGRELLAQLRRGAQIAP